MKRLILISMWCITAVPTKAQTPLQELLTLPAFQRTCLRGAFLAAASGVWYAIKKYNTAHILTASFFTGHGSTITGYDEGKTYYQQVALSQIQERLLKYVTLTSSFTVEEFNEKEHTSTKTKTTDQYQLISSPLDTIEVKQQDEQSNTWQRNLRTFKLSIPQSLHLARNLQERSRKNMAGDHTNGKRELSSSTSLFKKVFSATTLHTESSLLYQALQTRSSWWQRMQSYFITSKSYLIQNYKAIQTAQPIAYSAQELGQQLYSGALHAATNTVTQVLAHLAERGLSVVKSPQAYSPTLYSTQETTYQPAVGQYPDQPNSYPQAIQGQHAFYYPSASAPTRQ